jgi:hypothetical protein
MKKWLLIAAVLIAGLQYFQQRERLPSPVSSTAESATQASLPAADTFDIVSRAFRDRRSNVQVMSEGTVARVLADDTNGSRHQRFLLRLKSGQTVLVAHNIDLAPRVEGLRQGDSVAFSGEYEWNERGGVVHWTHKDPAGKHAAGWLRYDRKVYQ